MYISADVHTAHISDRIELDSAVMHMGVGSEFEAFVTYIPRRCGQNCPTSVILSLGFARNNPTACAANRYANSLCMYSGAAVPCAYGVCGTCQF